MNKERATGFKKLTEDALGITAYRYVRDVTIIGVSPKPRKFWGIAWGAGEFAFPTTSRVYRETFRLGTEFPTYATAIRDLAVNIASISALLATAVVTSEPVPSIAAMLITKFIANGAVHYEFSSHHPQTHHPRQ